MRPVPYPHARVTARALLSHTTPSTAFRGFGTPQASWAIESQLNAAAAALGLDPLEIRRRNLLPAGKRSFPATRRRTVTGPVRSRRPAKIFLMGKVVPTGTLRNIFMSAIVDPQGNAVTLQYDLPGRITSITDAIGQKTQLFYDLPITNVVPTLRWVPPYILTRVVDPFGRTCAFDYGGDGINARLYLITDAIGLTSTFRYDYDPGLPDLGMTNLITAYGTTTFKRGIYNGLWRANWVEITYPNGEKERVEYSEIAGNGVPSSEPLAIVPKGVPVRNYILYGRNTYYWDRKAYAQGYSPGDYSGARVYHWAHEADYTTASPILESFKAPLQHRIWFDYDGQINASFAGTSDQPTSIARTLEDGTTQISRYEYNSVPKCDQSSRSTWARDFFRL